MTETSKEKELNHLFDQNSSNDSFAKIIGKARRRTILRNVIISSFVLFVLALAAGIAWLSVMRWHEANAMRDIGMFSEITDPNVEEMGVQQEGNGLFEGILRFERYKIIEGTPVDWSEKVMTYSLFGGVSSFVGDHSPVQVEEDNQNKFYDRDTKQRLLRFYHPEVEYANLASELGEMDRFSEGTVAEAALSFDKTYTVAEIQESMPKGVTLKWYWVDTYSTEDLEWLNNQAGGAENINRNELNTLPELDNQVYGFEDIRLKIEETMLEENQMKSEDLFVQNIQAGLSEKNGKYYGEYKRIHDLLKGDSPQLTAANIRIIGAVVTGDAERLQSLQNLPMIRASAIGVAVNPYQ